MKTTADGISGQQEQAHKQQQQQAHKQQQQQARRSSNSGSISGSNRQFDQQQFDRHNSYQANKWNQSEIEIENENQKSSNNINNNNLPDQVDFAASKITLTSANGNNKQENVAQNSLLLLNSNTNSSKTLLAQEEGLMNSDNSSGSGNDVANAKNNNNNQTKNNMTYCLKQRWILILSMFVTFILAAILVAMLITNLSNKDDQCFNVRTAFQPTNYNLFSTKTTYSAAYNRLNNSAIAASKLGTRIPNLFSQSQSLAELNAQLSRDYDCKVRQFHYFGRHAARFPKQRTIEEIHKYLSDIQSRIDLSTSSGANEKQQQQQQQQQAPIAGNQSSSTDGTPSEVCSNPLASYKSWTSFMRPEKGNMIMESGFEETRALAQRFKRIFPDLFDSLKAKIEVGVTDEIRTAQTALVFMRLFENFNLDYCQSDKTSQSGFSVSSATPLMDSDDILDCSRLVTDKFRNEKLEFHKKCELYHTEKFPIPHLGFKDANRTEFIANSVSKKLKLSQQPLTAEETEAIYDICKYEVAYWGSSIWCNLFTEDELKFYEYINDLDDFFNQAYGHPNQMKAACPVTTELIKAFKQARASSLTQAQTQQPEAHFYFTHSQVIQKLLAASIDLESDPTYRTKDVLQHLSTGDAPEDREWRTSLFTPFSANLAFTLYECPKLRRQPMGGESGILLDVGEQHPLKVVASLNERTIKLDGCSSHVCDLTEILEDSRIGQEKRCKLEDICRQEIIAS